MLLCQYLTRIPHAHTHPANIHESTHAHTYANARAHIHTQKHARAYTHKSTHTHTYTKACTRADTDTHAHTSTHTHTRTRSMHGAQHEAHWLGSEFQAGCTRCSIHRLTLGTTWTQTGKDYTTWTQAGIDYTAGHLGRVRLGLRQGQAQP